VILLALLLVPFIVFALFAYVAVRITLDLALLLAVAAAGVLALVGAALPPKRPQSP
jgi:hypothetical protein